MSDPLHGVTLKALLETLVERHGWEELARRVPIRCFQNEPSIRSSLKFLRKTPWARAKVEAIFVREARQAEKKRLRNQRRAARRAHAQEMADLPQRRVPAPSPGDEPALTIHRTVPDFIHQVDGFLSAARCAELIAWSEAQGYEEARLADGSRKEDVRNNDRLILDDPELAQRWFERVRKAIPKDRDSYSVGLNERFRFYRYRPGQRFRHHTDGSFVRENGDFSRFTLLVYLNEDFEGGHTRFTRTHIAPSTGRALLFLHRIEHAGEAVTDGVKFVLRTDVMFRRGIRPGAL